MIPKPPWRARKEKHLAHLRETNNPSVLLVAAADKLHNVRTILADYRRVGDTVWSRFNTGKEGTLWYYRSLSEILTMKQLGPVTEDLARVVGELETAVSLSESSR